LRDDDGNKSSRGYISPQPEPDLPLNNDLEIHDEITSIEDSQITEIIERARSYARQGRLVDAEIEYSKALVIKPNENQLLSFASFLLDIGQLDKAILLIDRAINIASIGGNNHMLSNAFLFKGNVFLTRGDLDGAEKMYKKSLEIEEKMDALKE